MIEGSCLCGQVRWRFDAVPGGATACSCTACRRYGALWIYGHADEDVHVLGETRVYQRRGDSPLGFHFCPNCGCLVAWRGNHAEPGGKVRQAVNLRLAEPTPDVMAIPIEHFDGLATFKDLPQDGRTVHDMWF
jgi:hypothetical protein